MDEIERRMRAANPFPEMRLTAAQKRRLAEIQGEAAVERRPRRIPAFLAAAAVLAIASVMAFATFLYLQPTHVYAATPPPLETRPVVGNAADLLQELSMGLEGKETPSTVVRFESWGLAISPDEPLPSVVMPQDHTVEHRSDGSGFVLIQVGTPITIDGKANPTNEVGDTIWEQEFGPGEFPILYPTPPSDVSAVGEYLRLFGNLSAEPTTGDYITSLRALMSERNLTSVEESAVLGFLATLPDFEALGEVTDRLGREGIAFATETRTGNPVRDILIVSTSGQGILASEVTYLSDDRPEIPLGAVIDYIAWK